MLGPHPFTLFANPRAGTPGITVLPEAGFRRARAEITAWPGYAPTPLRALPEIAAAAGLGVLRLKDEAGRFGLGSFKALGGAYAVAELLAGELARRGVAPAATSAELLAGRWSAVPVCRAGAVTPDDIGQLTAATHPRASGLPAESYTYDLNSWRREHGGHGVSSTIGPVSLESDAAAETHPVHASPQTSDTTFNVVLPANRFFGPTQHFLQYPVDDLHPRISLTDLASVGAKETELFFDSPKGIDSEIRVRHSSPPATILLWTL